ncbi:MAG TPA: YdcF family protein [Stellaceae bacterium]|nr:YdcF family protein [Stellaceae bacterium]
MMGFLAHLASHGFLAPPAIFITLCVVGAGLTLYRPHLGATISLVSSLCLYAAATPVAASYLLSRVEARIPPSGDLSQAQAIVVLGANIHRGGGDTKDTLGRVSLERVTYAAEAYRKLHLPIAVSGGRDDDSRDTEAGLMAAALDTEFSVQVTWTEDKSRTTFENALFTQRLLQPANITTVVVVTEAWHMPRALWSFERVGFKALPWPAPRDTLQDSELRDFLPSIGALHDTFRALHEALGLAYYRMHY